MLYAIRHLTRFRYSGPITESVMEVRKQPRSEGGQHCRSFELHTRPRATVRAYADHLGNQVHHFDIPGSHSQLVISARALVEVAEPPPLPERLPAEAWGAADSLAADSRHWDWLHPSAFAQPTALLGELARELRAERRADPLSLLLEINRGIHGLFEYAPASTAVDSPIDEALRARRGVCQDYAHIMIALVRGLGLPCRYVSGYLFHRQDYDRSAADATHAWVEALLPDLGWVGFDPTNNLVAGERHIRAAIGRDYADVPPTRGVFRGAADSQLDVAVQVTMAAEPQPDEHPAAAEWSRQEREEAQQAQQQQ